MANYKSFKYRIKPTEAQQKFFEEHFEVNRYLFNTLLRATIEKYESEADALCLERLAQQSYIDELEQLKETGKRADFRKFFYKLIKGAKPLSTFDLSKIVTVIVNDPNIPWVNKTFDSNGMRNVADHVQKAFESKYKGGEAKFKRRGQVKSTTYRGHSLAEKGKPNSIVVEIENNNIKLPKMKFLNAVIHRELTGIIKAATITKSPSGKWHISTLVKYDGETPLPKTGKIIAFDQGLTHFLTGYELQSGNERYSTIDTPRFFSNSNEKGNQISIIKKLEKAQKVQSRRYREALADRAKAKLAKKAAIKAGNLADEIKADNAIKDSFLENRKNYQKAKIKTAKINEQIQEQRKYFQHGLTKELVTDYDIIIIENFSIKDLQKTIKENKLISNKQKKNTTKKLSDLSLFSFRTMLEQKANMYGKKLILLPENFSANQHCSNCQTTFDYPISYLVTEFECPNCHVVMNRAKNSAKNIFNKGLEVLNHTKMIHKIIEDVTSLSESLTCVYSQKTDILTIKEIIKAKKGVIKEVSQKLVTFKNNEIKIEKQTHQKSITKKETYDAITDIINSYKH